MTCGPGTANRRECSHSEARTYKVMPPRMLTTETCSVDAAPVAVWIVGADADGPEGVAVASAAPVSADPSVVAATVVALLNSEKYGEWVGSREVWVALDVVSAQVDDDDVVTAEDGEALELHSDELEGVSLEEESAEDEGAVAWEVDDWKNCPPPLLLLEAELGELPPLLPLLLPLPLPPPAS